MNGYATGRYADKDSWATRGACRDADPELFFPVASQGPALAQLAEAKRICAGCQVRVQCLEYALESGQDSGVWGGATEDERRMLRHARLDRRRIPAQQGRRIPAQQGRRIPAQQGRRIPAQHGSVSAVGTG